MTNASGTPWEPEFVGLPPADAPPAPDEPGGSQGRYATATWKPERIKRYRIVEEQEDETFFGYVTLQFAAELFDVQRERLQVACWRGSLPGRKVAPTRGKGPGQWFVHPGDAARYLATTLRGVSRRRRADELSPQRLERERQRLLKSAATAERVAAAKQAALAQEPDAQAPEAVNLRLRAAREGVYAKNRRRVAEGLTQAQERQAEADRQRAAWAQEHGLAPEDVES